MKPPIKTPMKVLVLDDGEVSTTHLCEVLRGEGAEVVRLVDLFEADRLLDSQYFDVLIGHEILLLLAGELKLASRRCLLAARPEEWTTAQLEFIGADAVVSETADSATVLKAVGLCR